MKQLSRRSFLSASLALAATVKAAEELNLPEDFKPASESTDNPEGLQFLSANRKFFKAKSVIQADYRGRVGEILNLATHAELLQLNPEMEVTEDDPLHYFWIAPYDQRSKIIKILLCEKKFLEETKERFSRLLKTRDDLGGGAWCHEPAHGVRFYRKDNTALFSTSLCWKCRNYFIQYPDEETYSWVGMNDKELESFMRKHLPVPEEKKDELTKPATKK